ncbi:MAG TPA: hypothetical protein VN706_14600 [Gemmatimonadaceae bacterium]|nr:hypothetical protein [Gemmatimonadaceae bacterium]
MRVGDFGVEVVAVRDGDVRELESGHVLAHTGTVYAIRLRNFGPLRCVADVRVDGTSVTARGLVVNAYGVVTLERPVEGRDAGRFTVIAEGDERVFGPDGGRDNPDLGSIEVSFRRELPRDSARARPDLSDVPMLPVPRIPMPPSRPMAPPEWTPPGLPYGFHARATTPALPDVARDDTDLIERAAGTGLTGRSMQEFESIAIGPLEAEATVLRLRIVIGTDDAFDASRPLADNDRAPARPPARP